MAEKVEKTGVTKEAGYLYYLGKDGHVWRTKMARGGKKPVADQKKLQMQVSLEKINSYTTSIKMEM